jgi:NTE family protein
VTAAATPGPSVSLVIGSGSVKCAAALGVVKALQEAGIGIDRVVGCSAGALFASTIALGQDTASAERIAVRAWTKDATSRPDRKNYLRVLAPRLFGFRADTFGLRDDRILVARVREVFGDRRIEDAPIPLHITATDFATGELVEISRGSIADAIRASLALPLAFAPVRMGDRLLVDGYLADPLPVSVAMKHGSRVIVAVGFESPAQENIRSAGRFAFQLSAIMANNLLKAKLAFHGLVHHAELIVILPEFEQRVRLFDTAKLPYIVGVGEQAMLRQLPYLRRLLASDPPRAAPAAASAST